MTLASAARVLALGCFLASAGPAFAQSAPDPSSPPSASGNPNSAPDDPDIGLPSGGFGRTLFQMFAVLAIVLLLAYVTLNFGLRRLVMGSAASQRNAPVRVIQRVPLDAKRTVFLLKAGSEYLVVGGGDAGLSLLCKLDPAEAERLDKQPSSSDVSKSPFLEKLLSGRGKSPPPTA